MTMFPYKNLDHFAFREMFIFVKWSSLLEQKKTCLLQIGQSIAINTYLAKKVGIAGKDEIEQAQALAIVELANDILTGKTFISI